MIRVTGGSSVDGNITDLPKGELYIDNGRIVYEENSADKTIRHYRVSESQDLGGLLIGSGNYLNPLSLSDTGASEITTDNSNVQDDLDNLFSERQSVVLSGGSTMEAYRLNEIQTTQSNPLPLASSVPANTVLRITVPKTYKNITTTHLASGSDTTTDSNGTLPSVEDPVAGFIFNWPSGGTVFVTSNGIDNWRY